MYDLEQTDGLDEYDDDGYENKTCVCENCAETGKEIKEGEQILYIPGVNGVCPARVYCQDSETYKKHTKSGKDLDIRTAWKI